MADLGPGGVIAMAPRPKPEMSPRWGLLAVFFVDDRGFAPTASKCHPFGVIKRSWSYENTCRRECFAKTWLTEVVSEPSKSTIKLCP